MLYVLKKNTDYSSLERDAQKSTIDILDIQKHHLHKDSIYRIAFQETHSFFLVISGTILLNQTKIPQNAVLFISKFSQHKLIATETTTMIEIAFRYSEDIPLLEKKSLIINAPADIREFFQKIYTNSLFRNNLAGVNEGLLLNIIDSLNLMHNSRPAELTLYQKCCDWIDNNSTRNITASDAAVAMSCDIAYLNRTIKKYSGKCLSSLINERKIAEIKYLLRSSNYSTAEIALKLNFASTELLRKFFQYHTGQSIKDFRKKLPV